MGNKYVAGRRGLAETHIKTAFYSPLSLQVRPITVSIVRSCSPPSSASMPLVRVVTPLSQSGWRPGPRFDRFPIDFMDSAVLKIDRVREYHRPPLVP